MTPVNRKTRTNFYAGNVNASLSRNGSRHVSLAFIFHLRGDLGRDRITSS
nr:MAG TPA: hypothetical protein [Caudoviricetes sp.]